MTERNRPPSIMAPQPQYRLNPIQSTSDKVSFIALVGFVVLGLIIRGVIIGSRDPGADLVREYLSALAEGRAEDALVCSVVAPTNYDLLTDEVLAKSLVLGPITDISVETVFSRPERTSEVNASYKIGNETINFAFPVEKFHGSVCLSRVTQRLSSLLVQPYIDYAINGVPLREILPESGELTELFPGSYELTIDNEAMILQNGFFTITFAVGITSRTALR